MNIYVKGLRVCLYETVNGYGGFVEETRRGGRLLGFVNAPEAVTAALQAAAIVAAHTP